MQHDTLLFQTFVLMSIANMFNCRVLPAKMERELNVVSHIFGNYWFLIIVLAELNIQVAMTGYPWICIIFGTTPMTFEMQMTALGCAIGSLLVGLFTKLTPFDWTRVYGAKDFGAPPKSINDLFDKLKGAEDTMFKRSATRDLMNEWMKQFNSDL